MKLSHLLWILGVYAIKLPIDLFITITAPIVFLFIPKSAERMPKFLSWYEDYNYGINGDPYWVNPNMSDHAPSAEAARTYKWRVLWSWRNANVFAYKYLGVKTIDVVGIEYRGDPQTSDNPGHAGHQFIEVTLEDGSKRICYHGIIRWGSSKRCIRYYLGWKLKDQLDSFLRTGLLRGEDPGLRRTLAFVFYVNPLKTFYVNN